MKFRQIQTSTSQTSVRLGMTVLELLVTMGLIALLITLLLPAVHYAREASRRTQCQNNFRQIGIALHLHHDTIGTLPAGWTKISGTPAASGWIVQLLPFLEQTALQQTVKTEWPASFILAAVSSASPTNKWSALSKGLRADLKTPTVLICPSDAAEPTFRLFEELQYGQPTSNDSLSDRILMQLPHSNYIGVSGISDPDEPDSPEGEGVLVQRRGIAFRDLTNGLSNVAVVAERTARKLPSTWLGFHENGEDAAGRVLGYNWLGPNHPASDECEFDSRHPGCIQMLFSDGHVRTVADEIDSDAYRSMAQRSR
jgi:type II secretory pathway pseudopilin PulG